MIAVALWCFFYLFLCFLMIITTSMLHIPEGILSLILVFGIPAIIIFFILRSILLKNDRSTILVESNYGREERIVTNEAKDLGLDTEHLLILPGSESIILDFKKGKIAFPSKNLRIFKQADLLSVQLVTDKDLASRKHIKSIAKNAIIGGVFLGGTGAIAAGLASSGGATSKTGYLALKFVFSGEAYTEIDSVLYDGPPISAEEISDRISGAEKFLTKVENWRKYPVSQI